MGNYAQRCEVNKVDHIFPAKDTKLLQKLLKTRGIYDETRSQILSNSLMNEDGKIINRCKKSLQPRDVPKIKAVIDLVNSVDKGVDLSNTVKKLSKTHCCAGCKSCIRFRDKSTQVKKPKSCCAQDRLLELKQNEQHFKLNQVHSDPGKLEGAVQRTHCQTTCIQVLESVNGREIPKIYSCTKMKDSRNYKNLMKNLPRMTNMLLNNFTKECNKVNRQISPKTDIPKANLYKNFCDMYNQEKEKKCKPCMSIKPVQIECCKSNVKTKNAFTKTCSKKKNIKSLANVNTDQCCANPCNKGSKQNLCVAKKSRKKASNECCKINKAKKERGTEISICCSIKPKPCKSYTEKKKNSKTIGSQNVNCSLRKKASQVKIQFFKRGTCQPITETRCGFQCRPKVTKSRYSHRSCSSRKKGKSTECKDFKRRQCANTVRPQCACDNNTQTKFCTKYAKPKPKLKSYYCLGKMSTNGGLNGAKCSKINKNKQDKSCCLRLNRCEPKGGILCQQHIQSECIIQEIQVKKSGRCVPCSKKSCSTKPEVTYCSKKVNTAKVKVRSISSISAQKPCIKAKKVQSIVQKPKKERAERQAVRIGSSCSFDIEFYKDRPKVSKPVEKCVKKNKSRGSITYLKSFVKKFNKSTKTKQTCCMMCYFVDISRNSYKSRATVSCSTGSLKSSVLSSVGCSSDDSINSQVNEKRLNMSDDYLSGCRKSFSAGMRKFSDLYYRNDEAIACSTEVNENILKSGSNINLQTKLCSEIRFSGELQPEKEHVLSSVDQCLETKQNFFFRKLFSTVFPNIITINFYDTNAKFLVGNDEKVKNSSMKDNNILREVIDLSKYCNWVMKTFMAEINSFKTIIKTCCRFVYFT